MIKLCECGCGEPAPIATKACARDGNVKGEPMRFVSHHQHRGKTGKKNGNWKGGKYISQGRCLLYYPNHPRSIHGYVLRYWLVVEKTLGRPVLKGEEVHHVDGNPSNDAPDNLVVCEDAAYHNLLHQRIRALKSCGHASWRKCQFCKKYDEVENLFIDKNGHVYHKKCKNEYQNRRYHIKVGNYVD